MIKSGELMLMVDELPIDIKTQLVEKLLNSMHPHQKNIDELWVEEAEKRVNEVKNGGAKTIPGETVFKEIRDRFSK
ncbi:MAG: addiction module protein [Nitrospinae bacterium]|nr:addiction module protein [Nitrospinota bacterium]